MKTVVFDLDGTLVHSAPDIHAAANALLAEEGVAPLSLDTIISFMGNGVPTLMKRMGEACNLPADAHDARVKRFLQIYKAAPSALTRPYPGVVDLLESLSAKNMQLAVCTNKPSAPAKAILRDLGLDHYFALVLGGDALPVRKPDPAPLLHVFDELGATERLFVGDSEVDAETASRAKAPFALFSGGYRKTPVAQLYHDYAFDHFDQLTTAISRIIEA